MRTYYADIEDALDRSSFLYYIDLDSDEKAITHFTRIFGDRVEMICIKGKNKAIPVYQKPGLFESDIQFSPIDYKSLLLRYIDHVGRNEGATFLESQYKDAGYSFTDREWEELSTLMQLRRIK